MNVFDKACAVVAFPLGVVFLILGILGLFIGCSANFSLPPILGVIPAFVGWGIIRPVIIAWRQSNQSPVSSFWQDEDPIRPNAERPPSDNPYDAPGH
jgi:hypothetical protein